jgi:hypothetical protein
LADLDQLAVLDQLTDLDKGAARNAPGRSGAERSVPGEPSVRSGGSGI